MPRTACVASRRARSPRSRHGSRRARRAPPTDASAPTDPRSTRLEAVAARRGVPTRCADTTSAKRVQPSFMAYTGDRWRPGSRLHISSRASGSPSAPFGGSSVMELLDGNIHRSSAIVNELRNTNSERRADDPRPTRRPSSWRKARSPPSTNAPGSRCARVHLVLRVLRRVLDEALSPAPSAAPRPRR
jgi:hypothetical protein